VCALQYQSGKAGYNVLQLKTCFETKAKSMHLKQEQMWGKYHQLHTSSAFKLEWKKFLEKKKGLRTKLAS